MSHEVRVPGDKSISHRALILASLAQGKSHLHEVLQSHDVQSTAGVLRGYGVNMPALSGRMVIDGAGLRGLRAPQAELDCGNSGTTARLMTGIAAALPFESRFTGDASLSRRPMRRLTRALEQMGATFLFENADGLPMVVNGGRLGGIEFLNENASGQIKSALLLAGLISGVVVTVIEPRPSRNHTELMLQALGADVRHESGTATIGLTERIAALNVEIPGDPSSAAFFAALAALVPEMAISMPDVCLNPTRLGFFAILREMGAAVQMDARPLPAIGELVGDIHVRGGELRGVSISRDQVPSLVDELPLIACLAARAAGETRVQGAGELRLKESDRIATIVANLRAVGGRAEELSDGFVIEGSPKALVGNIVTHGDHRIAMAFGILGAVPGNRITVDDEACASVSYPGFWEQLSEVAR